MYDKKDLSSGADAMAPSYFSINPELLDAWSYREIQRLCKTIGINAKGSKVELLERLKMWNKAGRSWEKAECGRFALVGVRISTPEQQLFSPLKRNRKARKSILKRGEVLAFSELHETKTEGIDRVHSTPIQTRPKSKSRLMFSPYNMVTVIPRKPTPSPRRY